VLLLLFGWAIKDFVQQLLSVQVLFQKLQLPLSQ
jgi:hypothetical protein